MTSAPSASFPRKPRKSTDVYSLVIDGGTVHLTTVDSTPLPIARSHTPPPPLTYPDHRRHILSPLVAEPSTSRLYVPYVPISRGPPSTNLYLYPPTKADYAKVKKQKALDEREGNGQGRQIIFGISVPRRSTRKAATKVIKAPLGLGELVVADNLSSAPIEKKGRKARGLTRAKNTATGPESVTGRTPVSACAPSTPHLPETTSSKKMRRKSQPRVNPRPTQRLLTRSLAKAQGSVPRLEVGEDRTMDIDTKIPDDTASESNKDMSRPSEQDCLPGPNHNISTRASMATSLQTGSLAINSPRPFSSYDGHSNDMAVESILSQSTRRHSTGIFPTPLPHSRGSGKKSDRGLSPLPNTPPFDPSVDDIETLTSTSSNPGASSSDTLCDDAAVTMPNLEKENVADEVPTDFRMAVDSLPSSSRSSTISLTPTSHPSDNGASPISTPFPPLLTVPVTGKGRGNKRRLGDLDLNDSPQAQCCRSSSRVSKKRKFQ